MKKYLMIIILFCVPLKIFGCNCIGNNVIKKEFKKSDVVFLGKVISGKLFTIEIEGVPEEFYIHKVEFTILVETIYKGKIKVNDTLKIITGMGNGDCGFKFNVGKEYILYAKYEVKYYEMGVNVEKFLSTDICSRTRLYDAIENKILIKLKKKNIRNIV